ncbi:hypothetical protein HYW75_05420 [Candidatus Pacearchaeota archaeon]|nr:hypothetical protein [Candidatus Pacearchaeota archaeon]
MRNLYTTLVLSLLVLSLVSLIPVVLAVEVGTGITPDITVEKFAPRVWMCDNRVVVDDNTEPGRVDGDPVYYPNTGTPPRNLKGPELIERLNNYAFEGEKIEWIVLVMDKNKIDQNIDVYGTVGSSQGEGNDIEVNCQRMVDLENANFTKCNARIQEERLTFDKETMAYFECTLTVETPESMHGEFWVTVEAQDGDGLMGTMDDGNDAEAGSGVLLDMFISGTDFYDSSSSGARCPTTNQLSLSAFRYFATSGAYSSTVDIGRDDAPGRGDRNNDAEGYTNIGYGTGFNNPDPFYYGFEILQAGSTTTGPLAGYYLANVLTPGAEMALTFKLSLPEPCNGDFDTGSIFFWGEAI